MQWRDVIEPEMRLAEAHAMHPRFGWEMRERGAQFLLAGWSPLEPFPEAMHFVSDQRHATHQATRNTANRPLRLTTPFKP